MTSFNLVHDSWVPVLDGTAYRMIGLAEAFADADSITVAAGGGIEDTALHRLLLAVTYAAVGAPSQEEYPQPFPGRAVAQWCIEHAEQFELLDSPTPFWQDPSLAESDAPILPPGILNPYLGRERPKVTDWRALDDEPVMAVDEAARLLIVQMLYSVGGRHKGMSASMPESSLTGLIVVRPAGSLAQALRWSRIPSEQLGQANWTWRDRTESTVQPTGDLDALTWLSRRYRLHHDGTQVTGCQQGVGWRRAPEADAAASFDSGYGRHDLIVAASSSTKPAKAAGIGGSTWRASAGDPIELTAAVERGGPDSLVRHVYDAVAADGSLEAPTLLACGHQIESKVLWQGAFVTPVTYRDTPVTERAKQISTARFRAATFGSALDVDLLSDDVYTVPAAELDTADADSDQREGSAGPGKKDPGGEVGALTAALRPTRPSPPPPVWPRRTSLMREISASSVAPKSSAAEDDDRFERLLKELDDAPAPGPASEAAADAGLWRLWGALHHDRVLTDALAAATVTTVPAEHLLAGVAELDCGNEGLRLWAGLAATWISRTPAVHWMDSQNPMPLALKHAGAATGSATARQVIAEIAATSTTPKALRTPLLAGLELLATAGKAPCWRSLHYDLTHWDRAVARQWKRAYWAAKPIPTTPR